jgi:hypothetical protein
MLRHRQTSRYLMKGWNVKQVIILARLRMHLHLGHMVWNGDNYLPR